MPHNVNDDFQTTMVALARGLHVQHIATFPFQDCKHDADIADVLSDESLKSFDQIPVRKGSFIVGVVERDKQSSLSGQVDKCMTSLNDAVLVSAEAPLMNFVTGEGLYRLVLRGSKIEGIVTQSDLLKLPVRLLIFSLVTHLEILLSEHIRIKQGYSAILLKRFPNLEKEVQKLKDENHELDALELANLYQKLEVAKTLHVLDKEGYNDLTKVRKLRNDLSHQHDYTRSEDLIQQFTSQLQLTQKWINRLSRDSNEVTLN